MADSKAKIVLVGHCGPDSYALRSAVGSAVPGAEVVFANDDASVAAAGADLMLVNRVLEGDFEDEAGIRLIAKLVSAGMKVMLVSNYPEAQAEAERAGALPGFGKTAMFAAETKERLTRAIGA